MRSSYPFLLLPASRSALRAMGLAVCVVSFVLLGGAAAQDESGAGQAVHQHDGAAHVEGVDASVSDSGALGFFTNYGRYMPRIHCLNTATGEPDWPWIVALVVLNVAIVSGYLRIFLFWRRSYLREERQDRNRKMMDLAFIFLWCAVCGYGMSLVIFVWPAYRLLAVFLAVLCFFTWRFAWNVDELGLSLSAKRLQRQLSEATTTATTRNLGSIVEATVSAHIRTDRYTTLRFVAAIALAVVAKLMLSATLADWLYAVMPSAYATMVASFSGLVTLAVAFWFLVFLPERRSGHDRLDALRITLGEVATQNARLRRLSLVASSTDNAVIITDAAGRIEWVNQAFVDLTEFEPGEVIGRLLGDVLHGPDTDRETVLFMIGRLRTLEGFRVEAVHRSKRGRLYWASVQVRPVLDDNREVVNLIAIKRDITDEKAIEERIQESERRFRSAFEQAAVGIAHVGLDGAWLRVNERLCDFLGYTEEELRKLTFQDLTYGPDLAADLEQTTALLAGKIKTFAIDKRYRHKSGQILWGHLTVSLVTDAAGNAQYFVSVVEDISERKRDAALLEEARANAESAAVQLQSQKSLLDNIIGAAPCGIFWKDRDSVFTGCNQVAANLMGIDSPTDVVGKSDADIGFDPAEAVQYLDCDRQVIEHGVELLNHEETITIRGKTRWVSTCKVPLRDGSGRIIGLLGTFIDITERKAFEARLAAETARAEAANAAKSEFLAGMSHELRTPLNGVIGMTELLGETPLDDKQRRFVSACHASGMSLLALVNDILDLAKIESGKMELTEEIFPFDQCVEDSVSLMVMRAHGAELDLLCRIDPEARVAVVGDSGRLRQVLINLLSNALKFTESGHVLLEVKVDEKTSSEIGLTVAVEDTGIGIPEDRCERLFDSFTQADRETSRKYGGTGLGLSIAKQLVSAMGGEIHVESTPGVGSRFWFTCRLRRGPSEVQTLEIPAVLRSLRAVVLSESEVMLESVRELLAGWGMDVSCRCVCAAISDPDRSSLRVGAEYDLVVVDVPVSASRAAALVNALELPGADSQTNVLAMLPAVGDAAELFAESHRCDRQARKPASASDLFNVISGMYGEDVVGPEVIEPGGMVVPGVDTPVKGRVLVAEDNATNQLYIREVLHRSGYACEIVPDGSEALAMVQEQDFDIVLMDCQMPVMDGFETTGAIRAWEAETKRSQRLTIIALTANALKGDRERCLAAGMDDYVTKPVQPSVLLSKIAGHLGADENDADRNEATEAAEVADAGPIDVAEALERCMGDPEFLLITMGSLIKELSGLVEALRGAVEAGDTDEVRARAHALKGAVSTVSAGSFRALCASVEEQAARGDMEGVRGQLGDIDEMTRRCLEQARATIAEFRSKERERPDAA